MQDGEYKVVWFETLRKLWVVLLFVVVTFIPFLTSFNQLTSSVRDYLAEFIVDVPSGRFGRNLYTGHYTIDNTLVIATIVAVVVLAYLLLIVGSFAASVRRDRARSARQNDALKVEAGAKDAELTKLRSQLDRSISDIKKLVYKLEENFDPRKYNFLKLSGSYFVDADGDTVVEEEITVAAVDDDVFSWVYRITGDEWTTPASFDSIEFKVEPLDTGTDCAIFPISNDANRKQVSIWFLPKISQGKTRSFKVTFKWKGFLKGLHLNKKTVYFWEYIAKDKTTRGQFSAQFIFSEHYGLVECQSTAAGHPKLDLVKGNTSGNTKWHFGGDDVPIGNTVYELTFVAKPE